MTKNFCVVKETLEQHFYLLQAQPLTFSQLVAVGLIYSVNERLMCATDEEGHEGPASIMKPQCQLLAGSTAAFHAQIPPSMSLVPATHQPSLTLIHHPHPRTASVSMDLHSQPGSPSEIGSSMLDISQAVFLLSVHTNQTVLNDFRALKLGLASGLEDSLKSYFKSDHVLQYSSAFRVHI